jgi:hypothetical protein
LDLRPEEIRSPGNHRRVYDSAFAEWRNSIYAEIRRMMQPEGKPITNRCDFTIEAACEVAQVSRAGFYRHYQEHQPRQAEALQEEFRK